MEQALRATGATVTALRSGHFQEKVLDVLDTALREGIYPVFAASADEQRPLVATSDIGKAAGQALQSPPEASETVDVLGPVYSERDIAAALSAALGKDLHVATIPESAWADTLAEAGLRPHIAQSLAELHRADARGLLDPRGDRRIQMTTPLEATIDRILAA